jgi:hypothetical protein
MARKLLVHLRGQWIGAIALLLVLTGGTAYALDGSNTVFTDDIVNGQVKTDDIGAGEVKVADVGQGAVATDELVNNQVKAADLGDGEVKSADIGAGQVGADELAPNSVNAAKIADGQVGSPEIGNGQVQAEDLAPGVAPGATGARAWGLVNSSGIPLRSKRVTGVSHPVQGVYCIDPASGIDTDAAVVIVANDFSTDDTQEAGNDEAHVEWVSVSQDCPDHTLEVRTFLADGELSGAWHIAEEDQGFAFVIP